MTKITTVRHGETHWNALKKIQGHTDIELNEVGIAQAEKIAQKFKNEPISIIYTSDLKRASKTAHIINQYHNVEVVEIGDLKETSFGEMEGQVFTDIKTALFEMRANGGAPKGGETLEALFARVHPVLDEIISENHPHALIVGHFGIIRSIICYFLKLPPEQAEDYVIGNTAIHYFEKQADGTFAMIVENDTSHLEEND